MIENPRFPHKCKILRYLSDENPLEDEEDSRVIYEGACRGYDKLTTSINGEVLSSYRGLSLPIKQNEWTEGTMPQEGDRLVLEHSCYTEYGEIIDRIPGNLGTHLLWKYVRN